jgi:hypothetical protein
MARRKKQLTQEQIDWRNSILRGKVKSIIKAEKMPDNILSNDDKIKQCFYYLNNCVYWLNEYIEGRVDKSELLKTAQAIQGNAKKLELLIR